MFTLNGLVQFADRYRARRRASALANLISGLSEDIQKDIGWPAADAPVGLARRLDEQPRQVN